MRPTKYADLAERLGDDIRAGRYGPDAALPTIRELMDTNGYSMATVTRAIGILEQEGLIRRIRGKGIFVNPAIGGQSDQGPRAVAANLNPLRVGVFCRNRRDTSASNMWWGQVLRGAESALAAAGVAESQLRMMRLSGSDDPAALIRRCVNFGINATISLGDNWPQEQLVDAVTELDQHHLPMVLLWSGMPRPVCCHSVDVDSRQGIWDVMSHLHDLGHERFVFAGLAGPYAWVDERLQAFREALRSGDDEQVVMLTPDSAANSRRCLRRALKTATAVVAVNDELAEWALAVAAAMGKGVPEDVSVTGFDDDFRYRQLDLTTVNPGLEGLGCQAIQLLGRLYAGEFKNQRVHLQVRPTLTVRHSTGPVAAG